MINIGFSWVITVSFCICVFHCLKSFVPLNWYITIKMMKQIGRATLMRLLIVYFITHERQQYSAWDHRSRCSSHIDFLLFLLPFVWAMTMCRKCAVSCNQSNRLPMDAILLSMRGIIIAHAIVFLFHFLFQSFFFLCDSIRYDTILFESINSYIFFWHILGALYCFTS